MPSHIMPPAAAGQGSERVAQKNEAAHQQDDEGHRQDVQVPLDEGADGVAEIPQQPGDEEEAQPRARTEATMKTTKSSPVRPLRMVNTL